MIRRKFFFVNLVCIDIFIIFRKELNIGVYVFIIYYIFYYKKIILKVLKIIILNWYINE